MFPDRRKKIQTRVFNGTEGSLSWDMEDLNRLHVFYASDEADATGGFRDILVTPARAPVHGHVVAARSHRGLGAQLHPRMA